MTPTADATKFDTNGNIVEQTVDNGDGTGTRTDYTTDPPAVTQLSGLPIPPPPPPPTAEERLASLVAALADAQSLEEIRTAAAGMSDGNKASPTRQPDRGDAAEHR